MSDMGWESIKSCYKDPNCVLDASDLEDVIHYAMQFEMRAAELEKNLAWIAMEPGYAATMAKSALERLKR